MKMEEENRWRKRKRQRDRDRVEDALLLIWRSKKGLQGKEYRCHLESGKRKDTDSPLVSSRNAGLTNFKIKTSDLQKCKVINLHYLVWGNFLQQHQETETESHNIKKIKSNNFRHVTYSLLESEDFLYIVRQRLKLTENSTIWKIAGHHSRGKQVHGSFRLTLL